MIPTSLNRFLVVSILVLVSREGGAPAQDGTTTILITPVNGVASSFELVRVHPDKVDLRRQGIRLNLSRDAIKSAKNPEASRVLDEALAILEEADEEKVEKIRDLLRRAERSTPRVEGVVEKFDWLIPEATQTLRDIRQTLWGLRDSARAAERLERLDSLLQDMAKGTTTLSATWEQIVDQGFEVSGTIPFSGIQEEFRKRFTRLRRGIRLDLSQRRTRLVKRIRTIGDDLLAQVESGTLNESRWTLAMSELDRLYKGIFDPGAKEEIAGFVGKVKETTSRAIEKQKLREAFARASEAVRALEGGLDSGEIAPATGMRVPQLERARKLLAALPESATKEILSFDLSDSEARVAQAKTAPVSREPVVGEAPRSDPSGLPSDPAAVDEGESSLLQTLKRSVGVGVALGAGAIVAVVALIVLAGWIMKKRKKAKTPDQAPEFENQYDIFQSEADGGSGAFSPSPVTGADTLPPEPPAPAAVEDPFGFGDVEPETMTESPEQAPEAPDITADLIVEDDPLGVSLAGDVPAEAPSVEESVPEDPFDLAGESEDPFDLATQDASAQPAAVSTSSEEDDPFGLAESDATAQAEVEPPELQVSPAQPTQEEDPLAFVVDEESPIAPPSEPEPAPQEPAQQDPLQQETATPPPESPVFDETLDDDPLGLNALLDSLPEESTPSQEAPEASTPSTDSSDLDDDPFGFDDLVAEDEEESAAGDDLFTDADSKD